MTYRSDGAVPQLKVQIRYCLRAKFLDLFFKINGMETVESHVAACLWEEWHVSCLLMGRSHGINQTFQSRFMSVV